MQAGMVRTQGGCGGSVGPRRYDHERGWSPFRPVQCLAAGVDESPEPTHRNSEPGVTIITRTRDNSNRKQTRYRSEEHTSELQSLMRNSYADFCLNKKNKKLS